MNKNISIYIASHKKFNPPSIEGYLPIEVGADLRDEHYFDVMDNTGDNISKKNNSFCELTAYYWIWKNSQADIVGLMHYRRYLGRKQFDDTNNNYINSNEIVDILKKYDLILPTPFTWKHHNVESGYYACEGYKKDLIEVRMIIQDIYPQYRKAFDMVLASNRASYCNIIITNKSLFDAYCKWLFDILFQAEKRIDISNYSLQEKRIFGYLSEILLNVWVLYNRKNIYYAPMVNLGHKYFKVYKRIEKVPFGKKIINRVNIVDRKIYDF